MWGERGRRRLLDVDLEEDPLALLVNFFDCSLVIALAFMVAASAGRVASDPVAAERARLERYRPTTDTLSGQGERLGVAYRLASGEVVYVPERSTR